MKGTAAKRNVCPGSCVSTGAKFPVAPVESAPMFYALFTSHNGNIKEEKVYIPPKLGGPEIGAAHKSQKVGGPRPARPNRLRRQCRYS